MSPPRGSGTALPDDLCIITFSADGTVGQWNAETGAEIGVMRGPSTTACSRPTRQIRNAERVGAVALVGNHGVGREAFEQRLSLRYIVNLAHRERERVGLPSASPVQWR